MRSEVKVYLDKTLNNGTFLLDEVSFHPLQTQGLRRVLRWWRFRVGRYLIRELPVSLAGPSEEHAANVTRNGTAEAADLGTDSGSPNCGKTKLELFFLRVTIWEHSYAVLGNADEYRASPMPSRAFPFLSALNLARFPCHGRSV